MFKRIRQMLIKEFIQVFRDPRMRAVVFIVPCMEVLVIGYAVNMDIRDIRTAVYDLDNTPASRELLARFSQRLFRRRGPVDDDRRMQGLIDRSTVQIVLRIDHGFAGDLAAGRTAAIQVHLRRHRFQHGGHRHELRQPHRRRLCAADARPADRACAAARPTRPWRSTSAAGRGSTRTWKAATTSCPG